MFEICQVTLWLIEKLVCFSVGFLAKKKNSKSLIQKWPEKSLYSIIWDVNVAFKAISSVHVNPFAVHTLII